MTERYNRIFALMRNSTSSSGMHSGPSFVVNHSAFSSLPDWERRAATLARGSHRLAASASGCFQLGCLFLIRRTATQATSSSFRVPQTKVTKHPTSRVPVRTKPEHQERQRSSQRTMHCHSKSASRIRLILSAKVRAFWSLPLAGSRCSALLS